MLKPSYKNYAGTSIRPENTQADISRELSRYGISSVQHTSTDKFFSVAFQAQVEGSDKPMTIRIDVPYNQSTDTEDRIGWRDQRRKYRALFYYIKALLIAWDDGLKTFAEVFMPHIVLPGGKTVSQDLMPKYAIAVESGRIDEVKLLPDVDNV